MFPRKPLNLWQVFAQALRRAETGFARNESFGQDADIGGCGPMGHAPDCYPFPSDWSGPSWVGPSFLRGMTLRQTAAAARGNGFFHFASAGKSVESGSITTNTRGKTSCGKLSPFFSFCRLACRPACKTPRRAGLPVRRLVRLSPMPPKATLSMAPSSAALRAWPRAASKRACRPATDLTAASRGVCHHQNGPVGAFPGWPFVICAPARGTEGREPCSRKS